MNTIYQIIYLNIQPTHLYFLVIFTPVNPSFTHINLRFIQEKKWEKGVTSIVSSKVMRITVVNLKLSTLQVLDIVEVTPFFQFFCVKQWFTCVNQ